ncbi:peptidylprolyl isomerase [Puia dinghuensis]|uniref:Periplasmic chaperone PpiD n=2 Tax=Puia dinghuensis TaxID=1792502 RepID=A0A8J2UFI9_9BACT|nr:peptidylprolyl isomerase [Puia dinghuensis]
MDAFVGRSRLFGNKSTVVGTVDGQKIEYNDFEKAVTSLEERYKAQGFQVNDAVLQNVRDRAWLEVTEETLLNREYESLGLVVSDKELNDMLVGNDAIPDVKQAFTDPKTGIFDYQTAAAQINQLRNLYKTGPKNNQDARRYEMAREFFEQRVPEVVKLRLKDKYQALLANSAYVPKWMVEKTNADNSQLAAISYVNTPYFTVADSAVKISDAEIQDYIDKHPDQYKQGETRSIAYVTFNAGPSAADSSNIKQQLTDLTKDFAKADDMPVFFGRVGSDQPFFDGYIGKSQIQVPAKDSIFALKKGETFGPYLDGGNWTVAKLIDVKTLPDSVRSRHILIATTNPRTGEVINEDSVAKKKIDSVKALLENGGNWDSIALKMSDDPGSKTKGGDIGYQTGAAGLAKEFADFIFDGKTGEKKIVKTVFGYHYIEITDQKKFEPAYKVAYLTKKIDPSQETDQAASGLASQFAGESRDGKAFDESVQKEHLQKLYAPDITPTESTIPGLGSKRELVKWVYDAEVGNVSEPFSVGDKYVVALLTEIDKEGTMSPARARNQIEPILRTKKKAEQIVKKLGSPASLDAASTASGQPVEHADSILFASPYIPRMGGQEPKVVGASFDKQLAGKPISPAIAGNGGVFFIKVENVSATSNPNADIQQQKMMMEQQLRQMIQSRYSDALRKVATIKDYRAKFF